MMPIARPVTPSPGSSPSSSVTSSEHMPFVGLTCETLDPSSRLDQSLERYMEEYDSEDEYPTPRRVFSFDEWAEPIGADDNISVEESSVAAAEVEDDECPDERPLPKFFSFSDWEERDNIIKRSSSFSRYECPTPLRTNIHRQDPCESVPRNSTLQTIHEINPTNLTTIADVRNWNANNRQRDHNTVDNVDTKNVTSVHKSAYVGVPLLPRVVYIPYELLAETTTNRKTSCKKRMRSKLVRFQKFLKKIQRGESSRRSIKL